MGVLLERKTQVIFVTASSVDRMVRHVRLSLRVAHYMPSFSSMGSRRNIQSHGK